MKSKKLFLSGTLCLLTLLNSGQALADKTKDGRIIGGIIGAVVGNNNGGDNGDVLFGALVGALIGGAIGDALDDGDKKEMERQRDACLEYGEDTEWRGNNGHGSFRVTGEGRRRSDKSLECRSYENIIYVRGEEHRSTGYACRDRKGRWREVKQSEIDYSNNDDRYGRGRGDDRRDDNRGGNRGGNYRDGLHCQQGEYNNTGILANGSEKIFAYMSMWECNSVLQYRRGPVICVGSSRGAYTVDTRTSLAVGDSYDTLGECIDDMSQN